LPIFIDKEELNRKIISLYEKDKKLTFADIFEKIYTTAYDGIEDSDIQNYYLLYAQIENKKMVIKDFEFVPSFFYKTDNYKIDSVFQTDNHLPETIDNIFEFQRIIVREFFDNCLFRKDEKKEIYTNNYWGEVKSQYCKTNNNYRLILQYRKAFYDFIYKSKKQSITGDIFKDIVLSSVADALQDEKYRSKNHAKEERIRTLLNIYFSLNQQFDKNNNNFNKITISMATKTKELLDYAKELVSNEDTHFENDNDMEFAFCFGQMVYYLLSQSEASKKTHSLLLAYLQKADFGLLKQKTKEDITKYSYKISFNNKKFNKMTGEILGYLPNTKFNDLISFFLAGYFSKNVIY
jgi:CRISPR-associated protein Csh1